MNNSLLELLISLFISAILFLVVDKLYVNLWLTRKTLEQTQERHRMRELPQQLFADPLFHAGNIGCRAVGDDLVIQSPANVPDAFFIQHHQAVRVTAHELWVHETRKHLQVVKGDIAENSLIQPQSLKDKSEWILISDCNNAELVMYGGHTTQSYQSPVYLIPILIYRWYVQDQTLYRQQTYPSSASQPVASGVEAWEWKHLGNMLGLRWQVSDETDDFVFELGNG